MTDRRSTVRGGGRTIHLLVVMILIFGFLPQGLAESSGGVNVFKKGQLCLREITNVIVMPSATLIIPPFALMNSTWIDIEHIVADLNADGVPDFCLVNIRPRGLFLEAPAILCMNYWNFLCEEPPRFSVFNEQSGIWVEIDEILNFPECRTFQFETHELSRYSLSSN